MQRGDLIGGRFELGSLVGSGGMGEVFRALDHASNEAVAVKVLGDERANRVRFAREAQVLAELRHPGIVRFVDYGETPAGEPYLVMEWLDGEDLARRLSRGTLSVDETVALGGRVAGALGAAHARGVIHRDLKPSNLLVVDGQLDQVKILDFGIAHVDDRTRLTVDGAVLGTPAYMAPERLRSADPLDARVDVFALGCVLFECLTGEPAFRGDRLMAILAKILLEETPRASTARPDVPEDLDALIDAMLAKNPARRPDNGAEVAAALAALGSAGAARRSRALPSALTASEQRLLSVVLVDRAQPTGVGRTSMLATTEPVLATGAFRRTVEEAGGRVELLGDGSMVATIIGTGAATDLAAQAARCALAIRAGVPDRCMSLATGWAEMSGRLPVGEAIDRAALLLAWPGSMAPGRAPPLAIDEVTAGLLDARFDIVDGGAGLELRGERPFPEDARTLLGKPTVCMGRAAEIATLEALWAESIDTPAARAALLTAPAGMGKSRLAYELLRAIRRRGAPATLWTGRGESLRAGSAFGVLAQVLQGAFGIRDGEALEVRREKLVAHARDRLDAGEAMRVAQFLGEIVGTPFPDEGSTALRAARQDAQLMGDQLREAFVDLLRAETKRSPVLVILEDLHWGDLPTVRFVGAALHDLSDHPWMVLGLARPEVHELFPELWARHQPLELRVKDLSRRASEQMVRHALGDEVERETVARLVAQADGHPFYLEELIRAVAEGRSAALPATLVAMVQTRLEGFDPDCRRVLRAASVFGETFWQGSVAQLLGQDSTQTRDWLSTLVEREVLLRRSDSRFPGEPELAFRHALLREGAYAMLTDEDRTLGHRLAGEWLERRGEGDAMVLAEHFERGKEEERAGAYYLRAAEQANRGGDASTAISRASRGLECTRARSVKIALLGLICEAHGWRSDWRASAGYADEIMDLAKPGSVQWARAAWVRLWTAMRTGRLADLPVVLGQIRDVEPAEDAVGTVSFALASGVYILDTAGKSELAEITLRRLDAVAGPAADRDPIARAWMNVCHANHDAWTGEDPWSALRAGKTARESFAEAGHRRGANIATLAIGMNAWALGALPEAEQELRGLVIPEDEHELSAARRSAYLVGVLVDGGALAEARLLATRMIEIGTRQHALFDACGRWALADVLRHMGELAHAGREALAAVDLLQRLPLEQAAALTTLAAVQLAGGDATEALASAERAMARYEVMRAFGFRGALARLVHAEALDARGRSTEARAALIAARDRLLSNAAKIGDPSLRKSFLEVVPENVRTLALARAHEAP